MRILSIGLCLVLSICTVGVVGCDCCTQQAENPPVVTPQSAPEQEDATVSKEAESVAKATFGEIEPKDLYQLQKEGKKPIIIDVRGIDEYQSVHVPQANLVPLDELDVEKVSAQFNLKNATFYLICRSGRRSATAAQKFVDAGIGKPFNVLGGTLRWKDEGFPVVENDQKAVQPAK